MKETRLAPNGNCATKCFNDGLGRVSNCYVAKVVWSGGIKLFEMLVVAISGKEEGKKQPKRKGRRFALLEMV